MLVSNGISKTISVPADPRLQYVKALNGLEIKLSIGFIMITRIPELNTNQPNTKLAADSDMSLKISLESNPRVCHNKNLITIIVISLP